MPFNQPIQTFLTPLRQFMKKSLIPAVVLCLLQSAFCWASESSDWLINPKPYASNIQISDDSSVVVLENGLARREIVTKPAAATVSLKNLVSEEEFIRATTPEGKLTINGKAYSIGGLTGQPVQNYLKPDWIASSKPADSSWTLESARIEPVAVKHHDIYSVLFIVVYLLHIPVDLPAVIQMRQVIHRYQRVHVLYIEPQPHESAAKAECRCIKRNDLKHSECTHT